MYRDEHSKYVAPAQKFTPDLHGLIAWLEGENPETTYNWYDCEGDCLIGHFATATNLNFGVVENTLRQIKPNKIGPSAYGLIGFKGSWTYGDALQRAKELAARQANV